MLTDVNPDPSIVEVQLVATTGRTEYLTGKPADVWAYRDGARTDATPTIPGPLLRARQGDRVVVHFRNELPTATTVHWHGLRLSSPSDGTTAASQTIESSSAATASS